MRKLFEGRAAEGVGEVLVHLLRGIAAGELLGSDGGGELVAAEVATTTPSRRSSILEPVLGSMSRPPMVTAAWVTRRVRVPGGGLRSMVSKKE